jgi:hypothetical protein
MRSNLEMNKFHFFRIFDNQENTKSLETLALPLHANEPTNCSALQLPKAISGGSQVPPKHQPKKQGLLP